MRQPRLLQEVAQWQAIQIRQAFPQATLLVGAPACGAVLATLVAAELDLPVAYVLTDAELQWHRMHVPPAGEQVVYIDDLIGTGAGAQAVIAYLGNQQHEVLGVSAWLSRVQLSVPMTTLIEPPFETYTVSTCPLCRSQILHLNR
ncbi:orotate phosphoribosyltransferase, partial [Deinococcus xianganensis]